MTIDLVRLAHFSRLSSSVGILSPNHSVSYGMVNRPHGMAAAWRDSTTAYTQDLLQLIAQDIPLVLLMHYRPNGYVCVK
jgi:hypothetical protein